MESTKGVWNEKPLTYFVAGLVTGWSYTKGKSGQMITLEELS